MAAITKSYNWYFKIVVIFFKFGWFFSEYLPGRDKKRLYIDRKKISQELILHQNLRTVKPYKSKIALINK